MTSAPDIASAAAAAPALKYRRDIDGLRALAVVPVVLYHFGIPGFSGGFVGVDIFFVISGFLITSILVGDMEAARYSLLKFYERRIRRIIPALLSVLALTAAAGLILLPPRAFSELGRSTLATLGFVSNVYFWRSTSGYFDGPAETRPLLHTWSLGVEEQFYIVFPIFLALVMRLGRRRASAVTAALFVVALIGAVVLTPLYPKAAFYLAPTRAWQLMTGALMALVVMRPARAWQAELGGGVGLLMIIAAVVFFNSGTATPGLPALLPCLGAALIIFAGAGEHRPMVSRLLSTPPFVAIGLISYSLYLWHWPVYVFLRHYIVFQPLGFGAAALGIALAVLLAALSWRFVEQPIRKRRLFLGRGPLFAAAGVGVALMALSAGAVLAARGVPARFADLRGAALDVEPAHPDWAPWRRDKCFVQDASGWGGDICQLTPGKPGGPTVLLWGDSYAGHYAAGFLNARADLPARVIEYAGPRCPPVLAYVSRSAGFCAPLNAGVFKVIDRYGVDTVILAAKWESYMGEDRFGPSAIGQTVRALQDQGLKVILVGQSPVFYFDYPDEYHLARMRSGARESDSYAPLAFDPELNDRLRQAAGSARFFDPLAVLCHGRQCLYRKNGHYVVADSGHYMEYGSDLMVGELAKLPELQGGAP